MIANKRKTAPSALIDQIDNARKQSGNLSSALRTFVLAYYVSETQATFVGPPPREQPLGMEPNRSVMNCEGRAVETGLRPPALRPSYSN
jgi:predicted DNA-binding ribbon-helix-helix protein